MALRHLILAAVLWSGMLAAPLWSWEFEVHRLINGQAVVLAADPGHYMADAHQPLHTTANYNGELTGNDDVYHTFENIMVDQHLGDYRPLDGIPVPTDCLSRAVFGWLLESFHEVPEILKADSLVRARLAALWLRAWEEAGKPTPPQ